jgi:hypothetical protein
LYTFNVSNLCVLPTWTWPNGWPKQVGDHSVLKLILIVLHGFVGTITVYIGIMNGLWFMWSAKLRFTSTVIVNFDWETPSQIAVSVLRSNNML